MPENRKFTKGAYAEFNHFLYLPLLNPKFSTEPMDKQQVIKSVKKLVGDAELEAALEELIAFLEQDDKYDALKNAAFQALSQLRKTKKDETLGIISFDNAKLNYNQVTHQTLNILDLLEEGKTKISIKSSRKNRLPIIMMAAVLLLSVVGFFVWRTANGKKQAGEKAQVLQACPDYSTNSAFNILLFRFQQFGGQRLNAHLALRQRLGRLSSEYKIPAEVGLFDDKDDDARLPTNLSDAGRIGENCKAQLVIIGSEEAKPGGDIIITQYRFLDLGEQFAFRQLKINERMEIDTVTSISSIATNGSITGNLEQAIFLLFGLVAHETNANDAAVKLLSQAAPSDSASNLLKGMVLADSYLALNETEKALASYDQVLEQHPNYGFALKNRAAIYTQKGEYTEAAEDLTVHLEANPKDADALEQRGAIYLEANRLDKAKLDLEKAKELKPSNRTILQRLKRLDVKIEEQRSIKQDADRRLEVNPQDVNALNQKADASKNLGDYRAAVKIAETILQQDPKNTQAYSTLVESFVELNQTDKIKETIKRINDAGVTKTEMLRASPTLRQIIIDSATLKKQ